MPEETIPAPTRPQRRLRPHDYVKIGFLTTLGAALLVLLALVTWRVGRATLDIIGPFVFATVLALLLDPVVDRLERRNMSRGFAVAVVFMVFVLIVVALVAYAVPALVTQIETFARKAPEYVQKLRETVNGFLASHHRFLGFTLPRTMDAFYADVSGRTSNLLRDSTGKITAFLVGSLSTIFEAIITLILTFYLLLDIDRLRARLLYLAPAQHRTAVRQYAHDIGGVFSDYLRGLLIVSGLYGVGTLILLLGLSTAHRDVANYALVVAVAGGLLYAVPYVGPLVTAVITFLVAFAAGGIGFGGLAVFLTLVLNQIFDNVITPRVVGGGVGLHPVAAIFALTLGGTLFGLWGLLLSVPVAASIQVVLFRLFPKLTTPTPRAFLRAAGVPPEDAEPPKIMEGDDPQPSDTLQNQNDSRS